MPVLGSTTTGSSYAVDKRGVSIPSGSLDVWRAARANHATDRPEVVLVGDSTMWGQCTTDANYSMVAKIRALSAAAGYTDGGIGMVGIDDTASQLGVPANPVQSKTTSNGRAPYNLMLANGCNLAAGGNFITYQWTFGTGGGAFRVWYAKTGDSGQITYAIDGGSTTTLTLGTTGGWGSVVIPVATSGSHTLTCTWVSGSNSIDTDILNNTGIVYHRHAIPGAQTGDFVLTPNDDTGGGNAKLQVTLGASTSVSVATQSTEGTHPGSRKVRLAVFWLGLNDLNVIAGTTQPRNAEAFQQAANLFVQTARGAGADPVIVIPHWKVNLSGTQYGRAGALVTQALVAVARGNAVPIFDANEALGGPVGLWPGNTYAPNGYHLRAAGYDVIATAFFNSILNV